jgi:hypothetical protein
MRYRDRRQHQRKPPMKIVHPPAMLMAALLIPAVAPAQAQDATDIFLADLQVMDDSLQLSSPVNVTARDGYDNHPWFLPDGSAFLYVSQVDGQTDVFRHDIATRASTRLTHTPENEYSPTLPGDGSRLMVVRWAADMSDGALWWYSVDGEPRGEATGSVPRVGYYAFADDRTLALFINDAEQSFFLSDTRTGEATRIGEAMGGSAPRRMPGKAGAVSFLRQDAEAVWWLSRLDVATREMTPLVPMLGGVANYTWLADGSALAAQGGTLHRWTPGSGSWRAMHTFDDPALQGITRLAVSPRGDRIALVSARPAD